MAADINGISMALAWQCDNDLFTRRGANQHGMKKATRTWYVRGGSSGINNSIALYGVVQHLLYGGVTVAACRAVEISRVRRINSASAKKQ